jgi:hypothetical protein
VGVLQISLVLAVVTAALAVVATASGTTPSGAKVKQLHAPILALALDGNRVAYFRGCCTVGRNKKVTKPLDKVMVWNVHTGKEVDVSGSETHQLGIGGFDLYGFQIAIDGAEVAWTATGGSNSYSEDRLYTSSLAKPRERLVAYDVRAGDCEVPASGCPGDWTGGLVSTGKRILLNQWTTDAANSMTDGGLFSLRGKTLTSVASGPQTVEASSADARHVAVLRADGTVGLYSPAGASLLTVSPPSARAVAVNGRNLVVLEDDGTLAVYDSTTGAPRTTFQLQGKPKLLQALAVHGNVAVYSAPVRFRTQAISQSAIHAINLTTGEDRVIGRLGGAITLASIDSVGLAYASNGYGPSRAGKATVVFVPFSKVAAAVS